MTKWYHIQSKWTGPAMNFPVVVHAVEDLAPRSVNLGVPNEVTEGWVESSTLEYITKYVQFFREHTTGYLTTFVLETAD